MTVGRRRRMVPNIPSPTHSRQSYWNDNGEQVENHVEEETSLSTPLLQQEGNGTSTSPTEPAEVIPHEESALSISLQVFIPFLVSGFGTVGAGMVLDIVQHWDVFITVSEIFILVPALLGLKGNLEMTLASRLSTQANLGNLDSRAKKLKMIVGNMMLVQAQALVVGFLAAVFAMVMGWIPEGKWNVQHGLILCASSMLTASLASLVLGLLMIGVVLLSRHLKINPDNVATPLAASLGDLTTLTLLSAVCKLMFLALEAQQFWLCPTLLALLLLLIPLFLYLSLGNEYVCSIVYTGWTPIICAMAISCVGGLVLDMTVSNKKYRGMAVFQPVMNGVGGNLVAVQASRLSTALHKRAVLGTLPSDTPTVCFNPITTFIGKGMNSKTARVFLAMVVPGHLVFLYSIHFMKAGHTTISLNFMLIYNTAALLQVLILLYLCNCMVHWMWKLGDDPDNFAIPYLTAVGDLLGTSLLALAFCILFVIGDRDFDVGD